MRALFVVLVAFALAGCLDAADKTTGRTLEQGEGAAPPKTAAPVVPGVDPELPTGSIEGQLLNDEQLPVPNATVALVGFNVTAYTDELGKFFFNGVNVGDYFIVARADGFNEKQMGVQVKQDEKTQITFVLDPVPRAVARMEPYAFKKSIGCARALRTPAGEEEFNAPFNALYVPGMPQAQMATDPCPPELVGDQFKRNATGFLLPTFGFVGAVFEAKWVKATEASEKLSLNVSFLPLGGKGGFQVEGVSPLRIVIKSSDLRAYEAVRSQHARYTDLGGRINYGVDVAPSLTDAAVDAGFAVDQDVDVAVTLFFVVEPDDYSKHKAF